MEVEEEEAQEGGGGKESRKRKYRGETEEIGGKKR